MAIFQQVSILHYSMHSSLLQAQLYDQLITATCILHSQQY